MSNFNYKFLTPFKFFMLQNFPFIDEDLDAITNYQMLCKMAEEINKIITSQNIVGKQAEDLTNAFNNLYNYVNNYFDNLDLQDEVNKKLDEMAQDGTLDRIINQKLFSGFNYESCKIICPKNFGNNYSSDCFIVKIKDKIIMIDTSSETTKSELYLFLQRNNITHIDTLILTHYHADHVGNVINLINDGFIDNSSFVYLPGYTPLIVENPITNELYNNINYTLNDKKIPHTIPNEFDILSYNDIDNFKITFYNCETSIFEEFNNNNYNDCSTVCLIQYGNKKALFTADIEDKPFKRFIEKNYFNEKIDFYKIEHHGINTTSFAIPFLKIICPDLGFQSSGIADFIKNNFSQCPTTTYLLNNGFKLFSQYNNDNDIIFGLSLNDIAIQQGFQNSSISNRIFTDTIYVNCNTTKLQQNGSENYPFKNLSQAVGYISSRKGNYTIKLSDGTYENTHESPFKNVSWITNSRIKIVGNENDNSKVILKQGFTINSSDIIIENLTFNIETENMSAINSAYSNVIVKNCNINTIATSIYSEFCSNLNIQNCQLTGTNVGISSHQDDIYVYNSTFNNYSIAIQNQNGKITQLNNTFNNVSSDIYDFDNSIDLSNILKRGFKAKVLFDGDTNGSKEINLNDNLYYYNLLILNTGSFGSNTFETHVLMAHSGKWFTANANYGFQTTNGRATLTPIKGKTDIDLTKAQFTTPNTLNSLRRIVGYNIGN